jgi:formiminotetrahydrofolate cyclodeaminase
MKKQLIKSITDEEIREYELLNAHLTTLMETVTELSKKKQDEVMNAFKVTNINRVLKRVLELIGDDPSDAFIEILDESSLPTNSDAMLTLKQFQTALKDFRRIRLVKDVTDWKWNICD